jgi:hypothetical protein
VKNDNMPRVVVPRSHASVSRQAPTLPATSDHVGGYDPYARPAGHVSVEEWRILIASLAGGFRVAQGATREISLAAGVPHLIAANDKSVALFVFGQSRVAPAIYRIGGDSASTNGTTGIAVLNQFEQVLLPRERLYAFSVGALTLDVTTLTI